jgi:16S rRNA (cytosine1402-N4)-methyltransferase
MAEYHHLPVLLTETTELLKVADGETYVDCTLGGGGHSENIKIQNPNVKIIAIDQDPDALAAAKVRLQQFENIEYVNDNFKNIAKIVKKPVAGILFDLGVSSHQIDTAERGFSFQKEATLDMRMDKSGKLTARDIINNYPETELTKIFWQFGEERFSKRIARVIVKERDSREITTTFQLKDLVEKAIPTWRKRESVARIFQALRIEVNQEITSLQTALNDALNRLKPGGRLVVISYHSLEDRIAKHTLKKAAQAKIIKLLTKKPVQAGEAEIASNPRAKSAKLRAAEKL